MIALLTLSRGNPARHLGGLFSEITTAGTMYGLDVSESRTASEKAAQLREAEVKGVEQARQLENPDARFSLRPLDTRAWLSEIRRCFAGKGSYERAMDCRFLVYFWEFPRVKSPMFFMQ